MQQYMGDGKVIFFFFNDTATTEIYTLSLHDALPISGSIKSGALPQREMGSKRIRGAAATRTGAVKKAEIGRAHV